MTTASSRVYTHQRSESMISRVLKLVLMAARAKTSLGRTIASGSFDLDPAPIPKNFSKSYDVRTETFMDRETWTLAPKEAPSDTVVYYIHGGAYCFNVVGLHWTLLSKLMDASRATFVVPNYHLAPAADVHAAYQYLEALYRRVLAENPGKRIVFMGDSAGGGLAIAFAQALRETDLPQPEHIITLSPWLDITMSNPDIAETDPYDKALNKVSLRDIGTTFAGDLEPTDPRVSPIYGTFEGVAKNSVFIGTHDIFVADTRKLRDRLDREGIPMNYYEYPKMIHTWALFPMREGKAAIDQMVELIVG